MKKLTRRQFIAAGMTMGACFFVAGTSPEANAAEDVLSYEFLCMKLYAKTEAEKKYLKDVVDKVKDKTVPQKFLYAAYRYAMKKEKLKRIIYFDRCLVYLCGRANIRVSFKSFSYTKA
ncbi:MAG: hypothetical protein PHQ75_13895 [Thermoguttaceae bacterium]|nr:hypothetical protein [Thermoguttaceae bacterium]